MLHSWIGRKRHGPNRQALISSCGFGASIKALLPVAMAAAVLSASNPALAQRFGKFFTKAIADSYAREADSLRSLAKKCRKGDYKRSVTREISRYKKLIAANGRKRRDLFAERGQLSGASAKNARRLGEIAKELARSDQVRRDLRTARDGLQKFRNRGKNGAAFKDCKKEKVLKTLPGFEYKFSANAGLGGAIVPKIGAGTVGDPGTESALVKSDGTLTGVSVSASAAIPLKDLGTAPDWLFPVSLWPSGDMAKARERARQFPGFQYQFGPRLNIRVGHGNLRGKASGEEPIGGRTSSFTYIGVNPATGTTGVNAGATGEAVTIKTRVQMVDLDIHFSQPVTGGLIGDSGFWVLEGWAGLTFSYSHGQQRIGANSLTFSGVSSQTELTNRDLFIGPRVGATLRAQHGPFYVAAGGWIAPGFFHSRGTARQHNLCDVCGNPADRDFRLKASNTKRALGVRAGIELNLGVFMAENIMLGLQSRYSFSSRVGGYQNPTSPTHQPARYGTNPAHSWDVTAQLKLIF